MFEVFLKEVSLLLPLADGASFGNRAAGHHYCQLPIFNASVPKVMLFFYA
ncbi:hypothetical protein [Bartonella quintana]|nr:hypothetical protein [Bartonella quintana]